VRVSLNGKKKSMQVSRNEERIVKTKVNTEHVSIGTMEIGQTYQSISTRQPRCLETKDDIHLNKIGVPF
jgi:hypothetical protein